MKILLLLVSSLLLQSCYGVNEKTSEIYNLNTDCLSKEAWIEMNWRYSTTRITDSEWMEKLEDFKEYPFPVEILYFDDGPRELIGVGVDHYSVRYVYNPNISNHVLDGLSSDLSDAEKKRIGNRIQTLLMQYQCEEGKMESLRMIEEEE